MKKYFQLIKPGIIFANLISVLGGFFFFQNNYNINFHILFFVLIAISCMIGSGCIFNNIIDIDIDKKMVRTQKRILVKSIVNIFVIKIVAVLLFLFSVLIFLLQVNILSCLLSILGFFFYVVLYSIYTKRISIYSTMIGSISGAIPPMVGYCSVSNNIDSKSILLFFIFCIWQVPHSYSIYILYKEDYLLANIRNIVTVYGVIETIKQMLFYIIFFTFLIFLLYLLHFIDIKFLIILTVLNFLWLLFTYLFYIFPIRIFFAKFLFYWSIIIIISLNMMFIFYI
ncbi:heme o synthase [Buchnera aphidicola]|uniref:heme o synthase n=1 Tax=Buchnera aphidicola TaxID=9 RepID=UPI003463AB5F